MTAIVIFFLSENIFEAVCHDRFVSDMQSDPDVVSVSYQVG